MSQAFRNKVQHQSGIQQHMCSLSGMVCCWLTCWQEAGIMNKVRPVRHAAGLVMDETLAGDEP